MHRQNHRYRGNTALGGDIRNEVGEREERSVTRTHNDGTYADDDDHDERKSDRAETAVLRPGDQRINRAADHEAAGERFTGDDQRDDVGHLTTHAVKENLQFFGHLLAVAGADILRQHTDGGTDKHRLDDVHLNVGNQQRAEDQNQSQRNDRQQCVNKRRMRIVQVHVIGRYFDIFFTHRLHYVTVAFIHVFLGKIMQNRDHREDAEGYRYLVIMPVHYRIDTGEFRRQNRTGVTWTPVEAKRGCDRGRGRKTADAERYQDREHGYHQEHRQTRRAVNSQT